MDPLNANFTEISAVTGSAGKPSGLATLDSNGKLVQMPTAEDVGATTCEYGQWTPVITAATTAPQATYSAQWGEYVKIDNLVIASFIIRLTSISGGSGKALISGLPYPPPSSYTNRIYEATYSGTTGVTPTQYGAVDDMYGRILLTYGHMGQTLDISNIGPQFFAYGRATYILRD